MTVPGLLKSLVENRAEAIALTVATLVMGAYWYVGSPGPALTPGFERNWDSALTAVLLAVGIFGIVPLVCTLALKQSLADRGVGLGDLAFNVKISALAMALVAVPMSFSSNDPLIQAAYPWPGAWAGQSVGNLAQWLATYFLYYIAFEYFFRGFLIQAVAPRWGIPAAIWMSAIACTLIHVGKPWPETLSAFPVSLLFGVMAVRGRSIIFPAIVHWWVGSINDVSSLFWQGQLNL
jgi:membrane protease YdiL (CAAX protease family)